MCLQKQIQLQHDKCESAKTRHQISHKLSTPVWGDGSFPKGIMPCRGRAHPSQNKTQTHTAASVKGWLVVSQLGVGGRNVFISGGDAVKDKGNYYVCLIRDRQSRLRVPPQQLACLPACLCTYTSDQQYISAISEVLDSSIATDRVHRK